MFKNQIAVLSDSRRNGTVQTSAVLSFEHCLEFRDWDLGFMMSLNDQKFYQLSEIIKEVS